jgi:hypothetical protein
MNNAEAKTVLEMELAKYRTRPYGELVALIGNPRTFEATAPSGAWYQIEVRALWDDPRTPNGLLRVAVAIDDGGLRAYMPLVDSFLLAPTGEFVGE